MQILAWRKLDEAKTLNYQGWIKHFTSVAILKIYLYRLELDWDPFVTPSTRLNKYRIHKNIFKWDCWIGESWPNVEYIISDGLVADVLPLSPARSGFCCRSDYGEGFQRQQVVRERIVCSVSSGRLWKSAAGIHEPRHRIDDRAIWITGIYHQCRSVHRYDQISDFNNNNNNLLFIHTVYNFTNSQRCEPCHLYELFQSPSLDTTSSTRC